MSDPHDQTPNVDPGPEKDDSLIRALPWFIAVLAVAALAGVAGYLIGHGNATSASEARAAESRSEAVAYKTARAGAELAAEESGEKTGTRLGERSGTRAGSREGESDGDDAAAAKTLRIEHREEREAEEALEAQRQAEQEQVEQAEQEYRESIHIEPDGSECSPGTGIGEPDPQCEPLPGNPDYDPNRGF